MESDAEKIRRLLYGRILILCHHNADPDAVCAAHAIKGLAKALNQSAVASIILPAGASKISRQVMRALGIEAQEDASMERVNALFIVDTGTLRQLEEWEGRVLASNAPKVFIDHHNRNEGVARLATIYMVDEDATSTCEIVYRVYRQMGIVPSQNTARALLTGMAYDSKHFTIGSAESFRAASELLDITGSIEEIVALLTSEMDQSERIARLTAAQRMRVHRVDGWLIAASILSSFQSSAARALLGMGADVAVVAGGEKGKLRASMRSTTQFFETTKLHLGYIAQRLGDEFNGTGSGHPTAAGMNAVGDAEEFIMRATETIKEKLSSR